jgi:hypothetical protein
MTHLARETAEALGFCQMTMEYEEAVAIIDAALIRAIREASPSREGETQRALDLQRVNIALLVEGSLGVPGRKRMADLIRRGEDRSR